MGSASQRAACLQPLHTPILRDRPILQDWASFNGEKQRWPLPVTATQSASRHGPENSGYAGGTDSVSRNGIHGAADPRLSHKQARVDTGASGNFGAGKQRAGRVFRVICQVHTNIFVAVKTVNPSRAEAPR